MTRIVAGTLRGRTLHTPPSSRTRPTSDRVREALFSAIAVWLGEGGNVDEALDGLAFLDLYAGSGAIGLEAMSRGAARVVLVESDRTAGECIRRNLREVNVKARLITAKVQAVVSEPAAEPFDIVFLDPPYTMDSADTDEVVNLLVRHGWVAGDGLVVLERSSRDEPPAWGADFSDTWSRGYGETTLYYAARGSEQ